MTEGVEEVGADREDVGDGVGNPDRSDPAEPTEPTEPSGRSDWWELAAAIILSLATVASAWSSYQAARWNGETTRANRAATQARFEATKASDLASRYLTIDVTTFALWLEAAVAGDDALATATAERFRPELRVAFNDWQAQSTEAVPPGTPFDLASYRSVAAEDVDRLRDEADERADAADASTQNSDNFVLTAVLYASVLFFAGIASKLGTPRAQHLAVALSGSMFVVATAVVATLPLNVGF